MLMLPHLASYTWAAMLVAPAIIVAQLVVQNGLAVLFPAWMGLGRARDRGIEGSGQQMLMVWGGLFASAVLLVPPALVAGVVMFLLATFTHVRALIVLVPAAVLLALLLAEALLLTRWLGHVLERSDLSRRSPAVIATGGCARVPAALYGGHGHQHDGRDRGGRSGGDAGRWPHSAQEERQADPSIEAALRAQGALRSRADGGGGHERVLGSRQGDAGAEPAGCEGRDRHHPAPEGTPQLQKINFISTSCARSAAVGAIAVTDRWRDRPGSRCRAAPVSNRRRRSGTPSRWCRSRARTPGCESPDRRRHRFPPASAPVAHHRPEPGIGYRRVLPLDTYGVVGPVRAATTIRRAGSAFSDLMFRT